MAPLAGTTHAAPDGFKHKSFSKPHSRHFKPRDNNVRFVRRHRLVNTPRIDARIANQNRRIVRGRKSGRLNVVEAVRLRGHLYTIRSLRRIARLDGHVTKNERRRLRVMLNKNSQRISRLTHNARRY